MARWRPRDEAKERGWLAGAMPRLMARWLSGGKLVSSEEAQLTGWCDAGRSGAVRDGGDGGSAMAGAIAVVTQRCWDAALSSALYLRDHTDVEGKVMCYRAKGGVIAPTHAPHRGLSCQDIDGVT